MDGSSRAQMQNNNAQSSDVGGTYTGPKVEPSNTQGTSEPLLKSRSPFVSSLTESDLNRPNPSSTRRQPNVPQRHAVSMNRPDPFTAQYPPPPNSDRPPASEHELSSRGVLSLQSSGSQSYDDSSHSNSAFSSYSSFHSTKPLLNQGSVRPQGASGGALGGYGHVVGSSGAYGGQVIPSGGAAAGPRLQQQGNVYPHPSEYQPMYYSGAPPHTFSGSNADRVVPYYNQQSVYGTQHPLNYGQSQALGSPQQYNYHNPAHSGVPVHYQQQQQQQQQQYQCSYHQVPGSTYSSHPSAFSSTVPYTQHGHQYQSFAPASVSYGVLPPDHPSMASFSTSSSMQGYSANQNGYAPAPIPYHHLHNLSSASSSNWDSMPANSTSSTQYTSGTHAGLERTHSPPQAQPVPCVHPSEQTHTQKQTASPYSNFSTIPQTQTFHKSHAPWRVDEEGPSSELSSCGEGDERRSHLLVRPLARLNLGSQKKDETTGFVHTTEQLPTPETCSTELPSFSRHSDDTSTSFLSGGLSSRREEVEDKTGFLPKHFIRIIEQPRDCTVALNGTAKLLCKAHVVDSKSEEEPDYLWYKDGEPLVGEIGSECLLEDVGEGEGGRYFCLVTHPDGQSSVKSEIAIVSIRTTTDSRAPVLIQQPEAYIEAVKGEPLVLTIEAEGEGALRYKWFKGAQELQYCRESVLRVPAASALDNGQYCCTVSNDYGSVLSDVVLVKVVLQRTLPPPLPRSSPSRRRNSSNPDDEVPSDRVLRQLASPVARHTKNWARLALYLGLLPADAADSRHYQASGEQRAYHLLREWRERKQGTLYALKTILSQAGISFEEPTHSTSVPSPPSSLPSSSQLLSLSISSQPRDVVVVYGQEAKLEVRADVTNQTCTYQWYKDGRKLLGKTRQSLIIASTVDSDEGSYTCLVSNAEGLIVSHPAVISVVSVQPQSLKHGAFGARESHTRHQQYPITSRGVYGLTGRGVDDDNCDEDKSEATTRSLSSKGASGVIQITEHPQSHVAPLGSAITLSCRASLSSGTPTTEDLTYVWYMNGLSLLEHTTPEYHIASLTEEDEGIYSCEVSSLKQSVVSQMASISVAK